MSLILTWSPFSSSFSLLSVLFFAPRVTVARKTASRTAQLNLGRVVGMTFDMLDTAASGRLTVKLEQRGQLPYHEYRPSPHLCASGAGGGAIPIICPRKSSAIRCTIV